MAYYRKDVSLLAKTVAVTVVTYALSPIDLIPDFIPVIGYLDDIILLPLGIALAIKLISKDIWQECKANVHQSTLKSLPHSKVAATIVIGIWVVTAILFFFVIVKHF